MMQTRIQSFIEAWVNVLVGYFVALAAQMIVFPLYEIEVTMTQNIQIGLIFTTVSITRSYVLRRLFNRLHYVRTSQSVQSGTNHKSQNYEPQRGDTVGR